MNCLQVENKAWDLERHVKTGFELQGFVARMKDHRDKCVGKPQAQSHCSHLGMLF